MVQAAVQAAPTEGVTTGGRGGLKEYPANIKLVDSNLKI